MSDLYKILDIISIINTEGDISFQKYSNTLVSDIYNMILFNNPNRRDNLHTIHFVDKRWVMRDQTEIFSFALLNESFEYEIKAICLGMLFLGQKRNYKKLKWSSMCGNAKFLKRFALYLMTINIYSFNDLNKFKAIELQSNQPFDTYIKTNYTESFIPYKNYELKESFYSSAILRNTKGNRKSYGVGKVESIVGNVLKFSYPISNSISCGDSLMIKDKSLEYEIININGKELKLSSVSQIAIGDICYGIKKYDGMFRPDGDPIRGKWMEVTLKSDTNEEIILNSVTTEVVESKL